MTRRRFASAFSGAALAQTAKPNVLVFMSDQESARLPGPANLPNRQRLLDRGIRHTNAFCNTPQCSPARSSLLTGLEPHTTKVLTNVDASSLGGGLSPDTPNLASVLKKAGYATGYFGKWHLGRDEESLAAFGFDTYERGSDAAMAAKAAEWIRKQKGPWLAWVSLLDPHHIYDIPQRVAAVAVRPGVTAPASGLENLKTKPSEQMEFVDKDQGKQTRDFSPDQWLRYRSFYLEMVETVDRHLGTVLDALPKDLADHVVAYTSDHGDALGEHGLPFKGPFMYDDLIRIPMVIAAPGRLPARQNSTDFYTQTDLSPALAKLAGVTWPGKTATHPPDAVFLEYYAKQKWVNPIRTIRTRRWKLNWYDRGNQELYDLQADPRELVNLAGVPAHAATRRELERRLNAWRGPLM